MFLSYLYKAKSEGCDLARVSYLQKPVQFELQASIRLYEAGIAINH